MVDNTGLSLRPDLQTLKLDGPQCLRHGGMEHLSQRSLQDPQATPGIKARYTKPNHKRART